MLKTPPHMHNGQACMCMHTYTEQISVIFKVSELSDILLSTNPPQPLRWSLSMKAKLLILVPQPLECKDYGSVLPCPAPWPPDLFI